MPNFIRVDAVAGQGQYRHPPGMFLRRIAVGNQGPQPLPIPGNQLSPHHLAHTRTLTSNPPDRNLLFPATADCFPASHSIVLVFPHICSGLDAGAVLHQTLEGLINIEQHAVGQHSAVVVGQDLKGRA